MLAALAYACGPTFLALLHTLTIALAMSFLPWMMALVLRCSTPARRSIGRAASASGSPPR